MSGICVFRFIRPNIYQEQYSFIVCSFLLLFVFCAFVHIFILSYCRLSITSLWPRVSYLLSISFLSTLQFLCGRSKRYDIFTSFFFILLSNCTRRHHITSQQPASLAAIEYSRYRIVKVCTSTEERCTPLYSIFVFSVALTCSCSTAVTFHNITEQNKIIKSICAIKK